MHFERDIFISYAHIDNVPLDTRQEGWISILHRGLEIRLAQLRGEKPKIWRDEKLQGNDDFSQTIQDQFASVAVLVAVLSPRYVKSSWCLRELQYFHEAAERNGGVQICDKTRLFKVIKTFLNRDLHPPELQRLLGYEFYEFDASDRPREFSRLYGPDSERKFWAKLEDLAYDIHKTLELLEARPAHPPAEMPDLGESQPSAQAIASTGKSLYLAETTYDLEEDRAKIRRELEMAGHRVLPEYPLPFTPDFAQQVQQNLAQCVMSIHLVSPQPMTLPGMSASSAELQQQLLATRSREQVEMAALCSQGSRPFSRIVWMPSHLEMNESDDFIKSLQSKPDFLCTHLENLKTLIHERLNPPPKAVAVVEQGGQPQIYLDCDERDLFESPELEPLCEYLETYFQVIYPDFKANGLAVSEQWLKRCEAVLIYHGKASGAWLQRRILALKKNLTYGRAKPLQAKAIYLAAPATPSKQNFADPEIPVIQGFGPFQPASLELFLRQLGHG